MIRISTSTERLEGWLAWKSLTGWVTCLVHHFWRCGGTPHTQDRKLVQDLGLAGIKTVHGAFMGF